MSAAEARITSRSGHPELVSLGQLSARIGRDPLLVQASSGNTSIKADRILWVKASGKWLADAEAYAPTWVKLESEALAAHRHVLPGRSDATPAHSAADLDTRMLLTLLDPVGGSVGLLPRLDLQRPSTPVSTLLWTQLIRLRLDGHLLVPGEQSIMQAD